MEDKKNKTEKKTLVKKNESVIAKNVVVRVGRLETVDVAQFKAAVNAFKRGNRRLLYDLFDNFDIDPFLYSVIGRMIDAVTNAEITFQIDGQNVEEIDDLIDTDEFEDFLAEIVKSVIFGKTVTECNFYPNFHILPCHEKTSSSRGWINRYPNAKSLSLSKNRIPAATIIPATTIFWNVARMTT